MKKLIAWLTLVVLYTSACGVPGNAPDPTATYIASQATLALINATIIDGTGSDPIPDAVLVMGGERILAVGPSSQFEIPPGVEVIDLEGAYMLPGFINAHVHDAYDGDRLEAWAQAGVTTVRDESILEGPDQLNNLIPLRDRLAKSPGYARLVSAGYMLSVPGGYGMLEVTSPEDARQKVNMELDAGADLIKIALESGYAGVTNLPNLSPQELVAIVDAAHERGSLVTAHITDARFLPMLIDAGVDDLAHIPTGFVLKTTLQQLLDKDIYVVPTLTVFEAYGALTPATRNLQEFVEMGVPIAMGNDYTLDPQNNFDHFELGMPMHELNRMGEAGMTPMQVIVASTRNSAHVCGLETHLGTLEAGKLADILVLGADPLQDLAALNQLSMVIHSGEIIRR